MFVIQSRKNGLLELVEIWYTDRLLTRINTRDMFYSRNIFASLLRPYYFNADEVAVNS